MAFNWPANDSPAWGVARTFLLITAALIAGCMIYNTAEFSKDFKFLLSLAFADGAMSVAGAMLKKTH